MAAVTTIVNPVSRISQGFGTGYSQTTNTTSLSGASLVATTMTFTSPQTLSNGRLRIKLTDGGGNDTAAVISASLTDGTSTVLILVPTAATTLVAVAEANSGVDLVVEFNIDINAISVTVNVTLTGTTKTANLAFDICGNQ